MMWYIVLIVIAFMTALYFSLIALERKMWNNGKCFTCGHPWHYVRTTDMGEEYICPKCKNSITIRKRFDNEQKDTYRS